ncbi:MAG TPA: polysaccharide biosynthesis tyrosine autokinase [Gemmatimonadales bacterium]|nr:polysaccharide biosynthesis tyrosine autokinase [Gemmatimonadales bacterium]
MPDSGLPAPAQPPVRQFDAGDDDDTLAPLDVHRFLGILRRHARLVLLITLLATGGAAAYAFLRQPLYISNAVIRVRDTRGALTAGLTDVNNGGVTGTEVNPLLSLIEVLTSRTVAGAVVDSLPVLRLNAGGIPLDALREVEIAPGLSADSLVLDLRADGIVVSGDSNTPPVPYGVPVGHEGFHLTFDSAPQIGMVTIHLMPRAAAVNAVVGNLDVVARPNTDVMDVRYLAADPALAQEVANRLVVLFRDANAEDAQRESHARRVFLEGQLREADSALAVARQAVAAFRARQRSYSARDRFAASQATASQVAARRTELTSQRQLYQQVLQRMQDTTLPSGEAILSLLSSPGADQNPAIRQLSEQLARYQAQKDSLTFGPYGAAATNPDVRRLSSLIATTQERLGAAVAGAIAVLNDRIGELDQQGAASAPSYRQLSANESDEASLLETVEADRRRGDQLREEYQNARLAEAVQVGQVEIVDPAGAAERTGLSPRLILILGLIAGLAAGCGLAFLLELVKPTIWRQRDLAGVLASETPIVIPRIRTGRRLLRASRPAGPRTLTMIGEPRGGSAEALRAVRTKLIFSDEFANLKALLVTSTVEAEGKSTVAANLAVAFAQQGLRVLLVDSDMRRANLHYMFGVKRSPGLSALLDGQASIPEVLQETKVPNLSLIAAGAVPQNPAELIGGASLREILGRLSADFDLVLLDSPPLLAVADASILGAMTDGVLLVVRAGRAGRDEISAARDLLENVGAHVVGAVLNDPDGEVARSGGTYYFYGYDSVSR